MKNNFNNKFNYLFNLFTYIIMFCIPIEPLIGPFYTYFKIIYICFSILSVINSHIYRKINKYIVLFLIFIIFSLISIFYTGHIQSSTSMAKEIVINFLLAISIAHNIRIKQSIEQKDKAFDSCLMAFIYGTLAITLYLLIFELPKLGKWGRLGQDLYENYGSFMVYSYCIIISISYLIWKQFFFKIKKKKNYLSYLILITLLIGAFTSGTRKSLICPLIFLFILILIKYKKKLIKLLISTLICLIIVFLGFKVIMNNDVLYNRIGVRIESMVDSIFRNENNDGSINERRILKKLSTEAFKNYPIGGFGLHAFRYYSYTHGGPYLYAHNNYYELLADLGIIGFSLYYTAYIYLIIIAIKKKNNKLSIFIISFLLMNLFSDYSTVSYYRHYYLILYMMIAAYFENGLVEINKINRGLTK